MSREADPLLLFRYVFLGGVRFVPGRHHCLTTIYYDSFDTQLFSIIIFRYTIIFDNNNIYFLSFQTRTRTTCIG